MHIVCRHMYVMRVRMNVCQCVHMYNVDTQDVCTSTWMNAYDTNICIYTQESGEQDSVGVHYVLTFFISFLWSPYHAAMCLDIYIFDSS